MTMTTNNVAKGLKIFKDTIKLFPNKTFFEVRTAVCFYHLPFWWKLSSSEKREIGRRFKTLVTEKEIKNVKWLSEYSDKHNWYWIAGKSELSTKVSL